MAGGNEIWGRRLKEARLAMGISQKQLGILAGLDPFVASTRINRYEVGVHKADYKIAQNLAGILNVPTGFFYTEDDDMAAVMVLLHRASAKRKGDIMKLLRKMLEQ